MSSAFSIATKQMNELIIMANTNQKTLVQIVNEVIGDGSPKAVFDTLQELKDEYPKGALGIYLVTENGNWYYWDEEWLSGGVYQATQLSDGSVTEEKLVPSLVEKIGSIDDVRHEAEEAQNDITNHKTSNQAHNAASITYNGDVIGAATAKQAIDNVQTQLNAAILSGDSSVAAAQAAVDANGHDYKNLKLRLDTENNQVMTQLADIVINVKLHGAKGTGVENDATILQNIINAYVGRTIYFPYGTYLLNAGISLPSNTVLLFDKEAKVVRGDPFTTMFWSASNGSIGGYDAVSNITITGGSFDAGSHSSAMTTFAVGHAKNITIRDCEFRNNKDWHMLEVNSSKNVLIENCRFINYGTASTGEEAIQIDLAINQGAFPWYGPYDLTPCENITIRDCYFENGNTAIGSHSASPGKIHKNIKIINCTFLTHRIEVIRFVNWSDVIIDNCYFDGGHAAIRLFSDNATAVKNIKVKDTTIKNMTVNSTTSKAIFITGVAGFIHEGIDISGVKIDTTNNYGIHIEYGKKVSMSNNTITGCNQSGIMCSGSDDVLIEGNTLFGNVTGGSAARHDINIGYIVSKVSQRNYVTNNLVESIAAYYTNNAVIERNFITKVGGSVSDAGGNTNLVKVDNYIAA